MDFFKYRTRFISPPQLKGVCQHGNNINNIPEDFEIASKSIKIFYCTAPITPIIKG